MLILFKHNQQEIIVLYIYIYYYYFFLGGTTQQSCSKILVFFIRPLAGHCLSLARCRGHRDDAHGDTSTPWRGNVTDFPRAAYPPTWKLPGPLWKTLVHLQNPSESFHVSLRQCNFGKPGMTSRQKDPENETHSWRHFSCRLGRELRTSGDRKDKTLPDVGCLLCSCVDFFQQSSPRVQPPLKEWLTQFGS